MNKSSARARAFLHSADMESIWSGKGGCIPSLPYKTLSLNDMVCSILDNVLIAHVFGTMLNIQDFYLHKTNVTNETLLALSIQHSKMWFSRYHNTLYHQGMIS